MKRFPFLETDQTAADKAKRRARRRRRHRLKLLLRHIDALLPWPLGEMVSVAFAATIGRNTSLYRAVISPP